MTRWAREQWSVDGAARNGIIMAVLCAPWGGYMAGFLVYEDLRIRDVVVVVTSVLLGALVLFVLIQRIVRGVLRASLFELLDASREGARRIGVVAGWIIGAPAAMLLYYRIVAYEYGFGDFAAITLPLIGTAGFLLTFVLVQAVFWAIEGFRSSAS